ncbi:MAG TPA: hypothetical protein VMV03_10670 [Spirochaetia bacterium]|nr:hypothetical protein [Spirochaetia bacterium]
MRRFAPVVILLLVPAAFVLAEFADTVLQAEELHAQGKYADAKALLLDAVAATESGKEKAELYWRLARETLELGDQAEKDKKPTDAVLAYFVEGEGYADKAIAADSQNDLGYFWKSGNIGRWGQVKGVFNALGKAPILRDLLLKVLSINPQRSDAYFVLGQLYREVPGWPLSFGDTDRAVSLGRLAVALNAEQVAAGTEKDISYDFSIELAKTLKNRNWSSQNRQSEWKNKAAKYAQAATPFDKGSFYEGANPLEDVSDKQEAKAILTRVIADMEALPSLKAGQVKDLQSAKDLLKSL